MDQSCSVVLHRPRRAWTDKSRAYQFLVDGELRGRIQPGQVLSLDIPPGRHWAHVRIDWTGSPRLEFEVAPGEAVHLQVTPRPNPLTVLWYLPGTTRWLRLTRI
jgi:hypothetical protein